MSNWQQTAPSLRTVLRPPSRPANRQRVALYEPGNALFSYPVAPFLDALVVIDDTHTRTFITERQREEWDVEPERLLRQGLANLDPAQGLKPHSDQDGLWFLLPDDGYASSRLLMPGWLDAFNEKCKGRPVATVPIAGALFIADSGNPAALEALIEQSWALYSKEANPVSPVPYCPNQNFSLRPWEPDGEHPLQSSLSRAFLYMAGNEYANQHALLNEWADTQDPKPFVAPFFMMKRKGAMGGMTVLPNGPTLLPMATWIRQGTDDPNGKEPLKNWADLVDNGTIRTAEAQWNPPRWRVG